MRGGFTSRSEAPDREGEPADNLRVNPTVSFVDRLDAALPQTQCTRCGYPDCQGYAQALAASDADINQCPPGGAEGVARLAMLSGRSVSSLNPANGVEGPRRLAVIDEADCIGCTLCLQACPVDCIVGGPKSMHTVMNDLCSGCELCLPVCPVDCISLVDVTGTVSGWRAWSAARADEARLRYEFHKLRLARDAHEHDERMAGAGPGSKTETTAAGEAGHAPPVIGDAERRRSTIDAALARSREARQHR